MHMFSFHESFLISYNLGTVDMLFNIRRRFLWRIDENLIPGDNQGNFLDDFQVIGSSLKYMTIF